MYKYKLKEESTTGGGEGQAGFTSGTEGENYASPLAFKYKLPKKKQLKEANTDVESFIKDLNVEDPDLKKFIISRILGFDKLEAQLNELLPLLQSSKHKTMDYYRQNPGFNVLYGTDIANDYLKDLIELFKD